MNQLTKLPTALLFFSLCLSTCIAVPLTAIAGIIFEASYPLTRLPWFPLFGLLAFIVYPLLPHLPPTARLFGFLLTILTAPLFFYTALAYALPKTAILDNSFLLLNTATLLALSFAYSSPNHSKPSLIPLGSLFTAATLCASYLLASAMLQLFNTDQILPRIVDISTTTAITAIFAFATYHAYRQTAAQLSALVLLVFTYFLAVVNSLYVLEFLLKAFALPNYKFSEISFLAVNLPLLLLTYRTFSTIRNHPKYTATPSTT